MRDHVHGRVYRITYPSRPLVTPAKVAGASIPELLGNLTLPEFRTRYRTRRELRGRDANEVLSQLKSWVAKLNIEGERYEHHLLEALWVTWGLDQVDESLLNRVLQSKDYHARAAAVRVLRYSGHQIKNQPELLMRAAQDENGRVRLEALVAATWLDKEVGLPIVEEAGKHPMDKWIVDAQATAIAHLNGMSLKEKKDEEVTTHLTGAARESFVRGKEIYAREGYCATCHQPDGGGLSASGFPGLVGTQWVLGNEERLIKIALNGIYGPMEVNGNKYGGQVPMTPFGGMLKDDEIAAVLTYVRNAFGNKASVISPDKVKTVREATKGNKGFYSPNELLKQYPMEK